MGGVAAQASCVAVRVRLVRRALVTGAAAAANIAPRGVPEAEQQALVSAAVYMIAARSVAGFATPPRRCALLRQLAVRRIGDFARHILVAGHAGIAAHVLRSLRLRRRE